MNHVAEMLNSAFEINAHFSSALNEMDELSTTHYLSSLTSTRCTCRHFMYRWK